jgi:hypothetical protein
MNIYLKNGEKLGIEYSMKKTSTQLRRLLVVSGDKVNNKETWGKIAKNM